jgi:ERCC4-type nuclease
VKGVGPGKARKIMDAFGSLRAVAEAEPAYLAKMAALSGETAAAIQAAAARAAEAGVEGAPGEEKPRRGTAP